MTYFDITGFTKCTHGTIIKIHSNPAVFQKRMVNTKQLMNHVR